MLTSLTITAGQRLKRPKRLKNLSPLWSRRDNIADWVMMSLRGAAGEQSGCHYRHRKDNDVIKALGELPNQLISESSKYSGLWRSRG
ncbi:hypothetical protein DMI62_18240 [Escherichia coli]|nr:hypothetical protein [Escherichia coli]